jgi:hypothetical protein
VPWYCRWLPVLCYCAVLLQVVTSIKLLCHGNAGGYQCYVTVPWYCRWLPVLRHCAMILQVVTSVTLLCYVTAGGYQC